MGLDFNPTFFSHKMAADNLTLSSPDKNVRNFWIRHGQACLKIAGYFADETGQPCLMNIWIPDGYKDIPADRMAPRARFMDALDQILSVPYDREKVVVSLESKVFGIGMESYTVGSPNLRSIMRQAGALHADGQRPLPPDRSCVR